LKTDVLRPITLKSVIAQFLMSEPILESVVHWSLQSRNELLRTSFFRSEIGFDLQLRSSWSAS
jgi:hypothetical protein